jgi:uncharacterized protein (TIGR03067 family)
MIIRLFVILGIAFLLAADKPPLDAVQKELKMLEGDWQPVTIERDGKKLPSANFQNERMTIKGDQLTVTKGGKVMQRAVLTVNPEAKPKTFEKNVTEGVNKGQKYQGIYEWDGDTFRKCRAGADHERPKEFSTSHGVAVLVWKRVQR